jgi:kinesin family member C2/C3
LHLSLLEDTISKKDEEIDRLQVLASSRLKSTKAGSVLKHSSPPPGMSMTSLGKVPTFGSEAASDVGRQLL